MQETGRSGRPADVGTGGPQEGRLRVLLPIRAEAVAVQGGEGRERARSTKWANQFPRGSGRPERHLNDHGADLISWPRRQLNAVERTNARGLRHGGVYPSGDSSGSEMNRRKRRHMLPRPGAADAFPKMGTRHHRPSGEGKAAPVRDMA